MSTVSASEVRTAKQTLSQLELMTLVQIVLAAIQIAVRQLACQPPLDTTGMGMRTSHVQQGDIQHLDLLLSRAANLVKRVAMHHLEPHIVRQ